VADLVGYNFALKAEYDKGDYKSQFYKMEKLNLSDFDAIQNNAGSRLVLKVERGPAYGVWISEDLADKVRITKTNKTLHINKTSNEKQTLEQGIIITCPVLNKISVLPDTVWNYKRSRSFSYTFYNAGGHTEVKGFSQDTMVVIAGQYTSVNLHNNKLNTLKATVGKALGREAYLTINGDNHINTAHLEVFDQNQLNLYDIAFNKGNYKFSKNAKINLTGKSLQLFKK
jgi:hypothetical protein